MADRTILMRQKLREGLEKEGTIPETQIDYIYQPKCLFILQVLSVIGHTSQDRLVCFVSLD